MSINLNQTYYIDRDDEYLKDLKNFIEDNYNISVIGIQKAKRGYMAETYVVLSNEKKLFVKIVSLESHKNNYRDSFEVVDFLNENNIDFILKNIKTKNNKLTCDFKNDVLGLFEFIEGEHSENYALSLLFEKYSLIYQININNLNIKKEDFKSSIIESFKLNVSRIKTNKEVIDFLESKKEEINLYEKQLRKFGKKCSDNLDDFHITHGDGQGNVIVSGNDIKIVDWDTPLLSPIERDAWVFLDNQKTLEDFNQTMNKNNIKYILNKERLYYYCYLYFFYYLTQDIEIILSLKDGVKIKGVFKEMQDLFLDSNWLQKRISIINKDVDIC